MLMADIPLARRVYCDCFHNIGGSFLENVSEKTTLCSPESIFLKVLYHIICCFLIGLYWLYLSLAAKRDVPKLKLPILPQADKSSQHVIKCSEALTILQRAIEASVGLK
jgi:hypothetical protein